MTSFCMTVTSTSLCGTHSTVFEWMKCSFLQSCEFQFPFQLIVIISGVGGAYFHQVKEESIGSTEVDPSHGVHVVINGENFCNFESHHLFITNSLKVGVGLNFSISWQTLFPN